MAKYHGKIGFVESIRTDGVYKYKVTEKPAYGEVLQNHRRWDNGDKINDDLDISNRIRIFADDFIQKNIGIMRYAEYMGYLWEIKSLDIAYPRITLLLGGIYNGQQASTAERT